MSDGSCSFSSSSARRAASKVAVSTATDGARATRFRATTSDLGSNSKTRKTSSSSSFSERSGDPKRTSVPSPRAVKTKNKSQNCLFSAKAVQAAQAAVVRIDTAYIGRGDSSVLIGDEITPDLAKNSRIKELLRKNFVKEALIVQPRVRKIKRGSGFIISSDGMIVTNEHVVGQAETVTVTVHGEGKFQGRVLGTDKLLDLAVLKIDPQKMLPVIKIGNSKALQVGDCVIAIGYPMGLSNSIAVGFVSGLNQYSSPIPDKRFSIIHASIPLSGGFNGGPIVTRHGEVVGIAVGSIKNAQSIGLAIPIDYAMHVTGRIEKGKSMDYPFLGLVIESVSPEMARRKNLKSTRGTYIPEANGALIIGILPGSPAEMCGLQKHDVIVGIDDKRIESSKDALKVFENLSPGQELTLQVVRDKSAATVKYPIKAREWAEVWHRNRIY